MKKACFYGNIQHSLLFPDRVKSLTTRLLRIFYSIKLSCVKAHRYTLKLSLTFFEACEFASFKSMILFSLPARVLMLALKVQRTEQLKQLIFLNYA